MAENTHKVTSTILFSYKSKLYKYLSNEYESKMLIDGNIYYHVYGYMYIQEYMQDDNTKAVHHLLNQESSLYCKQYWNRNPVRAETKEMWTDEYKVKIMERAILTKFITNKELAQQLLSTGESLLAYNNPDTEFWGCGKGMQGENALGKILMQVRAVIKKGIILGDLRND